MLAERAVSTSAKIEIEDGVGTFVGRATLVQIIWQNWRTRYRMESVSLKNLLTVSFFVRVRELRWHFLAEAWGMLSYSDYELLALSYSLESRAEEVDKYSSAPLAFEDDKKFQTWMMRLVAQMLALELEQEASGSSTRLSSRTLRLRAGCSGSIRQFSHQLRYETPKPMMISERKLISLFKIRWGLLTP
ncbi:hypothetical protein COLO4_13670 [Corchorus olitorius]|uniref:Uncharacterized protein n=1 Tax=Corchorus olitorius TaxID=93759 RepID=A0A1R3JVN0_9ROSI|nr:hypothetical protein COLO4_13670 [Corchorus olitorius]